jgi:rod shape-determining protein MreC
MHDKAVRRRRAVLLALVAASLILLTAYFGEPITGGLHSAQRGTMGILAPIQEGASRALKPARDLFGWVGDTIHAKSQRDQLQSERDAYRTKLVQTQVALHEAQQQAGLKQGDTTGGYSAFQPVPARLYARSPNTWYQTLQINKGTSDGVHRNDPVVNAEGLVGKVKDVTGGSAVVTLLTDQDFAVSGMVSTTNEPGSVRPAVGVPSDLIFDLVDNASKVHVGDNIVTSGADGSLYPKGILIGTVNRIDTGQGSLDRRIHIKPAANLRTLDLMQVFTRPAADLRAATTP